MKYVITLLIMILALSSCVGEKRKHEINADKLTMYINPHETLVVHPFDSLFKKRKVVKLETTNESLIGRIDKLVFYKGDIYILDKKQNKIFVFDKDNMVVSETNLIANENVKETGFLELLGKVIGFW